jgi:uncharacterized membrane protein
MTSLTVAATALVLTLWARPAMADFRICNNTASRVGVALGYEDPKSWVTEGWWNMPPHTCETLLRGALVARYYYLYAIDYDRGGAWYGHANMCGRDKEFTIRGIHNCLARGFDVYGFAEVDTGQQRSWTVQLTENVERAPPHPAATTPAAPHPAAPTVKGDKQ